jgi:hypothetical protein
MLARLVALGVLSLTLACGGDQASKTENPTPTYGDGQTKAEPQPATPEERNQAKLREAQDIGCEGMCERTTQCAIEDAKANMSAAELAELKLEETAPRHQEECTAECKASSLSVRQVEVLHSCLRDQDSSCQDFLACLDKLNPQK